MVCVLKFDESYKEGNFLVVYFIWVKCRNIMFGFLSKSDFLLFFMVEEFLWCIIKNIF